MHMRVCMCIWVSYSVSYKYIVVLALTPFIDSYCVNTSFFCPSSLLIIGSLVLFSLSILPSFIVHQIKRRVSDNDDHGYQILELTR